MILDAKAGVRGLLVNWETSQPIRYARWANLETGEYEALASTPDGQLELPLRVVRGQAKLKFFPARARAPQPAETQDDSDYLEEIERELGGGQRIVAVPGRECEERTCHRLATWQTAEEHALEPQIGSDGKRYERALTTKVHFWCDWHFQLPRHVSLRGVESEVPVRVRPQ